MSTAPGHAARMGSLDALFLFAEDGIAHMHIGSCATFAGPAPSLSSLVAAIDAKLHRVERFRQRVRFVPGNLGRPVWVDDPQFLLARHVHATTLPAPGDDAAMERLMSELMTGELPRDRPLWDMWLVDGLSHDRWALVSKVHHCMVDGIAGTDLLTCLLDETPDAVTPAPEPWDPAPPPSETRLVLEALVDNALQPAKAMAAMVRGGGDMSRLARSLRDTAAGLWSFGRILAPWTPHPSSRALCGTIGAERRWAVARCDLDDIKAIRAVFGGSINDVMVAVVAGAFRELLMQHGEQPDAVRFSALVPVSLRNGHDHVHDNQVSMIVAELPVEISDPLERLTAVHARMQQLKESHQVDAGARMFETIDVLPASLFSWAAATTTAILRKVPQRTVNTVITNVPGPQHPLYALGREMLEYLPFVPIGEGLRLGVAIITYNGHCALGITGDDASAADVRVLAEHIEAGVDALRILARPAPKRRARRS